LNLELFIEENRGNCSDGVIAAKEGTEKRRSQH